MKTQEFKYSSNGVTSPRKVMVYENAGDSIVGIDLGKLTPAEAAEAQKISSDYDKAMKPFVEKAFRRFKKEKIVE